MCVYGAVKTFHTCRNTIRNVVKHNVFIRYCYFCEKRLVFAILQLIFLSIFGNRRTFEHKKFFQNTSGARQKYKAKENHSHLVFCCFSQQKSYICMNQLLNRFEKHSDTLFYHFICAKYAHVYVQCTHRHTAFMILEFIRPPVFSVLLLPSLHNHGLLSSSLEAFAEL